MALVPLYWRAVVELEDGSEMVAMLTQREIRSVEEAIRRYQGGLQDASMIVDVPWDRLVYRGRACAHHQPATWPALLRGNINV